MDKFKAIRIGKTIRTRASDRGSNAAALDSYYIDNLILKKDGGFIIVAEERAMNYTSESPIIPNRSISFSLYDTYAKNGSEFLNDSPGDRNIYAGDYQFGNILVLGTDSLGNLESGNVVPKKQFGDFDLRWLSFAIILRSDKVDLIYNTPLKSS